MKWCTTAEQHAYMREKQELNLRKCRSNKNENWMEQHLSATGFNWTRQAQWGYRLFDFWCHALGIAVEVDDPSHDANYDLSRDAHNYNRSGILVLRVRNLNEADAKAAIERIRAADNWNERRQQLGLKPITTLDQ